MSKVLAYVQLVRPRQWLKNLMLLFPLLLSGRLLGLESLQPLIIPVLAFCLAASANYAINDVMDAPQDGLHPTKKHRPIPSGRVSRCSALIVSGVFLCTAFYGAITVSRPFFILLLVYVLLMGGYSLWLKQIVLLDIFIIAAGFLLRLEAGGVAAHIPISSWLFLSVFFLAVFLSAGKRMGEKLLLREETAARHRKTLIRYPSTYLEDMMLMTGTAAMLTYALYTVEHANLVYTVPLCCLGLLRYLWWIKTGHSGDPTEALLQDGVLTGISALWLVVVIGARYWPL